MARISFTDRRLIDEVFISSGYALDFTNATFDEFFASVVGIDISDPKFEELGTSKGNRLRAFIKIEDPLLLNQRPL
jgi:hypothetical protein